MNAITELKEPTLGLNKTDWIVPRQPKTKSVKVNEHAPLGAGSLYQHLEFDCLLEVIVSRLSEVISFDTINFRNTELGKVFHKQLLLSGSEPGHQLEYRIEEKSAYLGELVIARQKQFLSSEIRRINEFVDTLVGPLRNAILYFRACQSAYRDPLTGVQNRAALDVTLSRSTEPADLMAAPMALMVLDVDRFKSINDNCGHAVGDEALRQFASVLEQSTRETDLVYRYGGDEFVIVLANTTLAGGREYAERIRHSIEQNTLHVANACINLSTTIGLTELRAGESLDEAFLRADEALLNGKKSGRNKVVCR